MFMQYVIHISICLSVENYKKAATAIANFLLFKPNNEEMNDNKKYYIKNLGLTEDDFQPTREVLDYVNYWKDVEKSLNFVRDEYILPNSNIEDDEVFYNVVNKVILTCFCQFFMWNEVLGQEGQYA